MTTIPSPKRKLLTGKPGERCDCIIDFEDSPVPALSVQRHTCYDYATQQWLTGEPARLELLRQWRAELDLVLSPAGPAYLHSLACDKPLAEVLAFLNEQLASLSQP